MGQAWQAWKLGFRRDLEFEKVLSAQISSCEMVPSFVENVNGQKLSLASAYCPPNCRIDAEEVGEALRELGALKMVFGDFSAHSHSWGCNRDDTRARIVQTMLDDLTLEHERWVPHKNSNASGPGKCSGLNSLLGRPVP
jgi:hypothetical protein